MPRADVEEGDGIIIFVDPAGRYRAGDDLAEQAIRIGALSVRTGSSVRTSAGDRDSVPTGRRTR